VAAEKMSSEEKMQFLSLLAVDDFQLWDLIQKPINKGNQYSNLINLINSSKIMDNEYN